MTAHCCATVHHSGSGLSPEPVGEGLHFAGPTLHDLKSTYCFCAHMHEITKYIAVEPLRAYSCRTGWGGPDLDLRSTVLWILASTS